MMDFLLQIDPIGSEPKDELVTSLFSLLIKGGALMIPLALFNAREVKSLDGRLPHVECETCGAIMILDDLEEQYLLFIREPTRT